MPSSRPAPVNRTVDDLGIKLPRMSSPVQSLPAPAGPVFLPDEGVVVRLVHIILVRSMLSTEGASSSIDSLSPFTALPYAPLAVHRPPKQPPRQQHQAYSNSFICSSSLAHRRGLCIDSLRLRSRHGARETFRTYRSAQAVRQTRMPANTTITTPPTASSSTSAIHGRHCSAS